MSKFYDGNKILNLEIKPWNGSEYGCRMENDIFETAITGYDRETGMYLVEDAEGLIDYALDLKYGVGECDNPFVNPETIAVFVDGVEVTREGVETMKRIHIEFYGGESRYRNGAVNYMTVSPFETKPQLKPLETAQTSFMWKPRLRLETPNARATMLWQTAWRKS